MVTRVGLDLSTTNYRLHRIGGRLGMGRRGWEPMPVADLEGWLGMKRLTFSFLVD